MDIIKISTYFIIDSFEKYSFKLRIQLMILFISRTFNVIDDTFEKYTYLNFEKSIEHFGKVNIIKVKQACMNCFLFYLLV